MLKKYSDKELFFSSIRVINPEYQGDPELDNAIWKYNIGIVGQPSEYTYTTVLWFNGERYIDLGHQDRSIQEEDSSTSLSINPVYVIDFTSSASKYCKGRFSRSGAYKVLHENMSKFDKEYKEYKNQRNKQMQKKKNM